MKDASKQPAWEVGHPLNAANVPDALGQAGLNWKVEKSDIFVQGKKVTELLSVPGMYALTRQDNRRVLGVSGTHYTPRQNESLFAFCDNLGMKFSYGGCVFEGKRAWLMLSGDKLSGHYTAGVVVCNVHDGTAKPTVTHIVTNKRNCSAILSVKELLSKRVRAPNWMDDFSATEIVDTSAKANAEFIRVMSAAAEFEITTTQAEKLFRSAYGRKASAGRWKVFARIREVFEQLAGDPPKLSEWFWSVCQYEDFRPYHADPENRRLQQIWWGTGAKVKLRAYQLMGQVLSGGHAL